MNPATVARRCGTQVSLQKGYTHTHTHITNGVLQTGAAATTATCAVQTTEQAQQISVLRSVFWVFFFFPFFSLHVL